MLDHILQGRLAVGFVRGYQDRWVANYAAVPGARATTPDNAKRKDEQDAINRKIFEEAVRIDPKKDLPFYGMVMALMQTDQTERARKVYGEVGSKVYVTGLHGWLRATSDGNGYKVEVERPDGTPNPAMVLVQPPPPAAKPQ